MIEEHLLFIFFRAQARGSLHPKSIFVIVKLSPIINWSSVFFDVSYHENLEQSRNIVISWKPLPTRRTGYHQKSNQHRLARGIVWSLYFRDLEAYSLFVSYISHQIFHPTGSIHKVAVPQRLHGQGLSEGDDFTLFFEILVVWYFKKRLSLNYRIKFEYHGNTVDRHLCWRSSIPRTYTLCWCTMNGTRFESTPWSAKIVVPHADFFQQNAQAIDNIVGFQRLCLSLRLVCIRTVVVPIKNTKFRSASY